MLHNYGSERAVYNRNGHFYNNNNNNKLAYKAPVCQRTSEAPLRESNFKGKKVSTRKIFLKSLHFCRIFCQVFGQVTAAHADPGFWDLNVGSPSCSAAIIGSQQQQQQQRSRHCLCSELCMSLQHLQRIFQFIQAERVMKLHLYR